MIRRPAVAGSFYPGSRDSLIKKIEECFSGKFGPKEFRREKVRAGIVPHAGYEFSGQCAAWFYSRLSENKVFVIVGPNHTGMGYGFSVLKEGKWETPLGYCNIDENTASEILESLDFVKEDPTSHILEHSIEVQLPFLQYLFEEVYFVPICVSSEFFHPNYMRRLGEVLKRMRDVILIASSDFTHYGPWYGYTPFGIGREALELGIRRDLEMIERIIKRDVDGFYKMAVNSTICGYGGIISVMEFSNSDGRLLKYYTSSDITGDVENWVGYASIVF